MGKRFAKKLRKTTSAKRHITGRVRVSGYYMPGHDVKSHVRGRPVHHVV